MTRAVTAALAGVLGLVALTGCGSAQQGPVAQTGRGPSPTAPAASPATTSTMAPTQAPTTASTKAYSKPSRMLASVRVSGTVFAGVEPGCTLLRSKGAVYLLIGTRGSLATGRLVEVEGIVRPDMITTCQQGTPLVVRQIHSP